MNEIDLHCPICKQNVTSDASAPSYCRLCGMIIDNKGVEFCCWRCRNKFKKLEVIKDGGKFPRGNN